MNKQFSLDEKEFRKTEKFREAHVTTTVTIVHNSVFNFQFSKSLPKD